jgi:DNA-binding NarL/FixJ family response regulator
LATAKVAATLITEVTPAVRRVRALVVHQRNEQRSAISAMLEQTNGVDVIAEAKDSIVGVRAAISQQPDLIVADLDTATMCNMVRAQSMKRSLSQTKIVIVCAEEDLHLADNAGAYGTEVFVLRDGFSPELKARLERLFDA